MKSKILNKIVVSICCACLCIFAGVFFAACGNPEPTVQKIEIDESTIPPKYYVGDTFTVEGLKVIAFYSDGSEKEVTDYSYVAQKGSVSVQKDEVFKYVGSYTVVVTYKQQTASYDIEVKPAPVVTMLDVEKDNSYSYCLLLLKEVCQVVSYYSVEGQPLHDKDIYTLKEFVELARNREHIANLEGNYYIKVATLENFDEGVSSITLGNTVFGVDDVASIMAGKNKSIRDKVWYVEDDTLYVAVPVLYTEMSLSNQFKINDIEVSHNLSMANKYNITDFTTESTNTVVKDLDGTSNVTLLDETSPLSFTLNGFDEELDSSAIIIAKIQLENGGDNTCHLYAVGFCTESYAIGFDTTGKASIFMEDVKAGTDGVCDDLDGTSWNCSFVVKYWEETANSYKNNSYSCKFTISTQGD